MTISANISLALTFDETLSNLNLEASAKTIKHGATRKTSKSGLTTNSSQPVTKAFDGEIALTAGEATIDFTALTNTEGAFSATGLKLQGIWLRNKATNANDITIEKGETNGYTGLGAAFSITLKPGQAVAFDLNESGPDVSGTVKTLDVSGTLAQVLEAVLLFG